MLVSLLKQIFNGAASGARSLDGPASADLSTPLPPRSAATLEKLANFFVPVFWGVKEPERFATAVEDLTKSMSQGFHAADNFITWGRNNSMFDDRAFVAAWENNIESTSDRAIVWRRYVLATSAFHCVQLAGDFVERGAYTGVGVKTILDYLGGTSFPKQFWVYDVFEHDESMANHPMPELGPQLFERVRHKFADYSQVRIVKGLIPESFKDNCPGQIAYLHIDLNQAPAEIAALDQMFDRVVPGGIVILDDYEWAGIYRPQKLAEDEWFDARGYRVMPLPTGQGLIVKR
jgi:hypothetical protein